MRSDESGRLMPTPESQQSGWNRIDRIFSDALDLERDDRAAYLSDVCAGDESLRRQVEALLEASEANHLLARLPGEQLLAEVVGEYFDSTSHDCAADLDSTIGNYRLVRQLGRGGMGTVYLAHRSDGHFEQRVAVKLLRRGIDTEDVIRRFMAERQILASLDHPNIARLIDGGATTDGRPYLVMECVEGVPLTTYCDGERLSIRARLELMERVASVVEHAHRQLVVHRDLKPANILVTAGGEIKLLDFGIAKLLDPKGDATVCQTEAGSRMMTPEYASPEQLRGEPVTTATDVYQLGILLYELLTGCHPHSLARASDSRLVAVDGAKAIVPPSRSFGHHDGDDAESIERIAELRGSTTESLKRTIRGDLDAVVLTALASDTARRYRSARELAADLRRFLAGFPVIASRDTLAYRARMFVRRHKASVAAAAVLVGLCAGYVTTIALQRNALVLERNRTSVESERATRTEEFLTGLFVISDPNQSRGATLSARDILDAGTERLRAELHDQPHLRTSLLRTIADVYVNLGSTERAVPLLEEVIALRRSSAGRHDPELSADLHALARIVERTAPATSDRLYLEALHLAERLYGPDHVKVAGVLVDYGHSLEFRGQNGIPFIERSVTILRAATGDVREQLAHALTIASYGDHSESGRGAMREALRLRRELHGDEHLSVAASYSDLALATEASDPAESVALLERSMAIYRRLVEPHHPLALRAVKNLAAVHRNRGAYAKAEPLYRQLIELREQHRPGNLLELSSSLHGLGVVLNGQKLATEAKPLLRRALELQERGGLTTSDSRVLDTRLALAESLLLLDRHVEAETMLAALDEQLETGDPDNAIRTTIRNLRNAAGV
jgi:eukaryotic-like serine/threonine-protein kinase